MHSLVFGARSPGLQATRCVGLLARTFMTLSLSQIAAHAALPAAAAAEAHLLKLVGSAEICARIDQPRATVV